MKKLMKKIRKVEFYSDPPVYDCKCGVRFDYYDVYYNGLID
ncbi:hypothetical protein [Abyssisolibacter fermentans]|nr:hypothetical protein [Abyssisolibacter fermentans]